MRNVILQVCTRNGQIEKHNCGAVKKAKIVFIFLK